MLTNYFLQFKDSISIFNLFEYLTFKSALSAITALLISFIIGPIIIGKLKKYQIGEEIRTDGPQSHLAKKGTPTMGGVIIIFASILPTLLFSDLNNTMIIIVLLSTIWMGTFGFIDDYLKIIVKTKSGMVARYKLLGQIILGVLIGYIIIYSNDFSGFNTKTTIPFLKNFEFDFGVFYPILVIIVITGTSNAVNLTDGLDGLAIGLLAISFSVFTVISYISGRIDFSEYLNILYLPNAGELSIFSSAVVGACLGFLWFNASPAEIFMGDTGSLSLGAALGTMSILLKKELLLFIIGGVFVIETLSVIIQVSFFRYTKYKYGKGERFFKMAPVHHHYELSGIKESKIVIRFWIIGVLLALLSLATLKVR
jgi:phospho-N-acetylmuramoyl-pentapeptide-transferase|tara:strand:+ start:7619 stop:8722 length:1104 start_codon:yes stop_codon:yes gene_type:complete